MKLFAINNPELMIDIGRHSTKVLLYKKGGSAPKVINFASFATPPNLYNEDGTVVSTSVPFVNQLKKALKSMGYSGKTCGITIPTSGIIVRELTLPNSPEKHLANMIKLEIPQHFLININDFVLDYKIVGKKIVKDAEQLIVMVVAVPNEIINSFIKLLQLAGLQVTLADFCSNSVCKISDVLPPPTDKPAVTTAYVDFGYTRTNVSICKNGKLRCNRSFQFGCADFEPEEEQTDEPTTDANPLKLDYAENREIAPDGLDQNVALDTTNDPAPGGLEPKFTFDSNGDIVPNDLEEEPISDINGEPTSDDIEEMFLFNRDQEETTPDVSAPDFDGFASPTSADNAPKWQIDAETMKEVMDTMTRELGKIFDFYTSRELYNRIDNIVFTGGGSHLENIEDYVVNEFDIPTTVLDQVDCLIVERNKAQFQAVIADYANCIGAAVSLG